MPLNKQKGNMYPFVTHTLNFIKGKCPHDCSYCYMKIYHQPELHLDVREFKTNLGHHNFIFVGSSCDMWAEAIPNEWIAWALKHCRDNDAYNKYLFQTKNPARFEKWLGMFPDDIILGTTIETNRIYHHISQAPNSLNRKKAMVELPLLKMVSIEPIIDFDLDDMVRWIKDIAPEFVSIGADSKGHKLPEPPAEKVQRLVEELQGFTTVKIKGNLKRLLRQEMPVCQNPQ